MKILANYNVGIYCRLSRDDGKKGKQESMSIENQKRLLKDYVKEKGWNLREEHIYVDDGKTGMNFERDGFKNMARDLKEKHINCVIVKSIDRLGRGSQTESVIEDLFIIPQIRFIAIGESVDTINGVDYLISLLHAMNGIYPMMVSDKVKEVKKKNTKLGMFMNSQAPYGYKKSPQDKHLLIPDEVAAQVVHRIFYDFANGDSARMIADRFNREKLDTPRFYHYTQAGKINPLSEQANFWNDTTVLQLLRNQAYIGNLVSGKREVASIKTKKIRRIPQEDWVVVENTHEPIIPRDLWDKVQERLTSSSRVRKTKTETIGLFSGMIKCAECGSPLAFMRKKLKNGERCSYRCSRYNNKGSSACSTHLVYEEDISEFILKDIKQYAVLSAKEREHLSKQLMAIIHKNKNTEANTTRSKIECSESRLKVIAATLKSLYEDKCAGKFPEEVLSELMTEYTKERNAIEESLPRLRRELDLIRETKDEINEWLSLINSCIDLEKLDRETVCGLINHIVVSESVKQNGNRTQEITIEYRFIGNLLQETKKDIESVS